MLKLSLPAVVGCLFVCSSSLFAQSKSITSRVDALLNEKLAELGWQPTEPCDDATFLRRAYLDLTGNAPVAQEVVAFLDDKTVDKRAKLVDRLLESPNAANHLANTWANWLLPQLNVGELTTQRIGLRPWLRSRFADNLRYDRLVADMLISTGPIENSPTGFFVALENKPEKIAAKTARVFMGVQLDCAECHNHPFDNWKQADFWGFAAYFARLSAPDAPGMVQVDVKELDTGEVKLPGTETVVAPKPLVDTGLSGLSTGTRRQQLTLWLTARENPFLARAAVNRVWAMLFGRGLIEPIDDMRTLEMASHPKILAELSDYFAENQYNLRALIAALAKTEAYARTTRHEKGVPPEASYAVMMTKPLTETQLTACLTQVARQVVGDRDQNRQQALLNQLGKLRGDASQATLGIVQALVTLHGDAFDQVSRDDSSRLLVALNAPHMTDAKRVEWLFLSTLNRRPLASEQAAFASVIASANSTVAGANPETPDNKTDRLWQSDLLWALINSTEFAMTP